MPRLPKFAEPSTFVRFYGGKANWPRVEASDTELQYIRLLARESPLKYHFRFASVGAGVVASQKTFGDLELKPEHIAQVYVGVSYGARARLYHPLDVRLLKWDELVKDVQEKDTANIEHEDSPLESPRKEIWIAPTNNLVPAMDVENIMTHVLPARSIDVHLMFLAALFQYEFVDRASEPEIYEKLVRSQIPSRFITFGGKV